MKNLTDKQIENVLGGIVADGFNRCLGALVEAGAIDTSKLNKEYKGVGSKYYDLVTEQIEITARYGTQGIRRLLSDEDENTSNRA
jgi:transcription initiation factor IIE alpha subunit